MKVFVMVVISERPKRALVAVHFILDPHTVRGSPIENGLQLSEPSE